MSQYTLEELLQLEDNHGYDYLHDIRDLPDPPPPPEYDGIIGSTSNNDPTISQIFDMIEQETTVSPMFNILEQVMARELEISGEQEIEESLNSLAVTAPTPELRNTIMNVIQAIPNAPEIAINTLISLVGSLVIDPINRESIIQQINIIIDEL